MSETTITMNAPQVAPRLLRRSTTDRVFGGVCGGLGRYWNVDPVILRVAFGVSLLLGGFGLFAYLAMWWLVPDDQAPAAVRVTESWGLRIVGAFAATIAALIALGVLFSDALGGGGVVLGALVAGIVVWIVMSQRTPQRPAVEPEPGFAYGGAGDYTQTTVMEQSQPSLPPAPPRERSYLGLIGLCAAIAASGVAMLFGGAASTVLAAALLALGITLLVGAFAGRARWLLIFAVPLLMMLAVVSQVERADITTGQQQWSPTAQQNTYSLTAGQLTVHFDDWQGQPGPGDRIAVDMGVGELRIEAPRNWDLVLRTDLGVGEVLVVDQDAAAADRDSQSFSGERQTTIPASSGEADGRLVVDVSMRAGSVQVITGAPAAGDDVLDDLRPEGDTKNDKTTKNDKEKKA
jgi:phage shock protein PspC (stress-responsive transcriptional regulator)